MTKQQLERKIARIIDNIALYGDVDGQLDAQLTSLQDQLSTIVDEENKQAAREQMEAPKWDEAKILDAIATNDEQACKALMVLYDRQTADEQLSEETKHNNGVGFNGLDAGILSSFAEQYKAKGWLSKKQLAIVRKKLPKYRKQLVAIANERAAKLQRGRTMVAVLTAAAESATTMSSLDSAVLRLMAA